MVSLFLSFIQRPYMQDRSKWCPCFRVSLLLTVSSCVVQLTLICSFFSATLFCGVDVSPFFGALAVGIIMLVAAILLPFFVDRVRTEVHLLEVYNPVEFVAPKLAPSSRL